MTTYLAYVGNSSASKIICSVGSAGTFSTAWHLLNALPAAYNGAKIGRGKCAANVGGRLTIISLNREYSVAYKKVNYKITHRFENEQKQDKNEVQDIVSAVFWK